MKKVSINYKHDLECTKQEFNDTHEEYNSYEDIILDARNNGFDFEDCSNKVIVALQLDCENEPIKLMGMILFSNNTSFLTFDYATIVKENNELYYFELSSSIETFQSWYEDEGKYLEKISGMNKEQIVEYIKQSIYKYLDTDLKIDEKDILISMWL